MKDKTPKPKVKPECPPNHHWWSAWYYGYGADGADRECFKCGKWEVK